MSAFVVGTLLVVIIIASVWFVIFYNIATNYKTTAIEKREFLMAHLKKRNDLIRNYIDFTTSDNNSERKKLEYLLRESSYLNCNLSYEEIKKADNTVKQMTEAYMGKCMPKPDCKDSIEEELLKKQLEESEQELQAAYISYEKALKDFNAFLYDFPNNAAKLVLGLKAMH